MGPTLNSPFGAGRIVVCQVLHAPAGLVTAHHRNTENLIGRQSSTLIVYAIDGDGNKTQKRYHFRIENLRCNLSISPPYGIFENNSVIFKSTINGGKGNIQKLSLVYRLIGVVDNCL